MNKEDIEMIIDLLIYIDTKLLWRSKQIDIEKAVKILPNLEAKHQEFKDPNKRHTIISNMIDKLRAKL